MSYSVAVGQGFKLINKLFHIFSRGEKHERVEDGLISTGDYLSSNSLSISRFLKVLGKKKCEELGLNWKEIVDTNHYSRRWVADRKKLR